MRITISGLPGSGTTTVSKKLAKKLNYKYIDAGQVFRQTALEHEMSLYDFEKYILNHPAEDKKIDKKIMSYAQANKDIILEGRLTGWMTKKYKIPAFKIWFFAPNQIRAKRVTQREKISFKEAFRDINLRESTIKKRYKKYYQIDINDTSIYDLRVNSSKMLPEEIIKFIFNKINKKL